MRVKPDCIPCILKMSIALLRKLPLDTAGFDELFGCILELPALRGRNPELTSPDVIEQIMALMTASRGPDPFGEEKAGMNKAAEAMLPLLKARIAGAQDPVNTALRIAIQGNAIDFMMSGTLSQIETRIIQGLETPVSAEAYTQFLNKLQNTRTLVYLTDNAGEIVFDRLLLETLKAVYADLELYCIVRRTPTLNDATLKEARAVGLDIPATIMDNGISGPLPGTRIHRCSEAVKKLLKRSDLIISKGGGNFDTLSEDLGSVDTDVTFLLLSKCYPYRQFFGIDLHLPILYNAYDRNRL